MKSRLLIIIVSVCFLSLLSFVPHGDASRIAMSLEDMIQRSDAIAIGTIQSTWIDVRPFDDHHVVVDTAKVKVDEWLKNDKNTKTLEIRYYGYWAKMMDDLRGMSISDNPHFNYELGQKVLIILDHEESTGIMGGGYYPLFQGSFVINENMAISQDGEQTTLQQIYDTIHNLVNDSKDQRLHDILESCDMFGPQPNEEKIQSANDTHHINNNECQWHKKISSGISLDRTVYLDGQFCADEFDKMRHNASEISCSCCNAPPEEPVCEPKSLESHIRDMVTAEFKPCVSTVDSWAHLTENNDSALFTFGTNYVTLKMDKANLEEDISISITFSGYSQCLNDFHLIIKEHIGSRKVVFEESHSQVCDESKPNNEFKTYREINLDGIGKPITLDKEQYLVELYTDTPQKHGSNYVDKIYFSSHFETRPVIKLNAINQKNPSIWTITGTTTDMESEIILNLYNSKNVFVTGDIIVPNHNGEFSVIIATGEPLFKLSGLYKLTLQQGDVEIPPVSRLFDVIKENES